MPDTLIYPRGTALIFTAGEYSDFGLCGELVTILDCDLPALAREFRAANLGGEVWQYDVTSFSSWLVANGHAMPMDVQTVHLGEHSIFETEFGVPS